MPVASRVQEGLDPVWSNYSREFRALELQCFPKLEGVLSENWICMNPITIRNVSLVPTRFRPAGRNRMLQRFQIA